jgi:transcriptional regulator with XRE-family HTH domain
MSEHPLTKLRRAAGIKSQRELARRAGMRSASISEYEAGKVMPSPRSLARLARALDVPIRHLLPLMLPAESKAPQAHQ